MKKTGFYHFHISKSGGTSLNYSFLSLFGDPEKLYKRLVGSNNHKLDIDGKKIVAWNRDELNKNNFYYGFSHQPIHKLNITKTKVLLSILRDPLERILSYYRMYRSFYLRGIWHPSMGSSKHWKGLPIDKFVYTIPYEELNFQLYMFSGNLDPKEAYKTIKKKKIEILRNECLNNDICKLSEKYQLDLEKRYDRKNYFTEEIDNELKKILKSKLKYEYEFYYNVLESDAIIGR